MKTLFLAIVFFLYAFAFTGCNDDFGTPNGSVSSASNGSIQVKVSATASPYLKDGDDDDEPEPMFCITGVITESGNPISAEVELMSLPQSTLVDSTNTDSNGGFEFNQVPSGSYNVVVIVDGNVIDVSSVNL